MREYNNKLIAEFMGWKVYANNYGTLFFGHIDMFSCENFECTQDQLQKMFHAGELDAWFTHQDAVKFHLSWDWLMPVIDNIRQTHYVFIFPDAIAINENKTISSPKICKINGCSFDSHYEAVIKFIKWFNEYRT